MAAEYAPMLPLMPVAMPASALMPGMRMPTEEEEEAPMMAGGALAPSVGGGAAMAAESAPVAAGVRAPPLRLPVDEEGFFLEMLMMNSDIMISNSMIRKSTVSHKNRKCYVLKK